MNARWLLYALALGSFACGSIATGELDAGAVDSSRDAMGADATATPDAPAPRATDASADVAQDHTAPVMRNPPAKVRVASDAALHATAIHRAAGRIYAATLWSGFASHQNISLHSFDAEGRDPQYLGHSFFRSGLSENTLAQSAIAASSTRVAVALRRGVFHQSTQAWAAATNVVVFSLDERAANVPAASMPGADGLFEGPVEQRFSPSISAASDGWWVLDMTSDHRLRLTKTSLAGAIVSQQQFPLPFMVRASDELQRWAVRARGEGFVVATNDEAARLLFVDARGITNITAAIQPISRVFSRPYLCAGDGEEFEFAQSDANSATLWALHLSPERALASVSLEGERDLRMCAAPRLWLRIQPRTATTEGGADLWSASSMQARCAIELRAPNERVQRTVDVNGTLAIATDVEDNAIDLRPVQLDECVSAR